MVLSLRVTHTHTFPQHVPCSVYRACWHKYIHSCVRPNVASRGRTHQQVLVCMLIGAHAYFITCRCTHDSIAQYAKNVGRFSAFDEIVLPIHVHTNTFGHVRAKSSVRMYIGSVLRTCECMRCCGGASSHVGSSVSLL